MPKDYQGVNLQKLYDGISAYKKDVHPGLKKRFSGLAKAQNPKHLFVTCSDSRVVPSAFTQTGAGDLFVIRNAGNIISAYGAGDLAMAGTLEYAVDALQVENIIICGHAKCGAVGAIVGGLAKIEKALPEVKRFLDTVATTDRLASTALKRTAKTKKVPAAIQANVLVQLANLRTHPSVAAALAAGRLTLHGWVHDFTTGGVEVYDAGTGKFVDHTKASAKAKHHPIGLDHI